MVTGMKDGVSRKRQWPKALYASKSANKIIKTVHRSVTSVSSSVQAEICILFIFKEA